MNEPWISEEREFDVIMASDLDRDGMSLEVTEVGDPRRSEGPSLELFYNDVEGRLEFVAHRAVSVPAELVESLLLHARESLPPHLD